MESGRLLEKNAGGGCPKKSPTLGSIQELAKTWAEAYPSGGQSIVAARDIINFCGKITAHQVTPAAVASLVSSWKDRYAKHTAYTLAGRLRHFLKYVRQLGGPDLLPFVPKLRTPKSRIVIAKPEEFQRMLALAQPWMRLFLLLTGQLGLRFSEACQISPRTFHAENHTITFKKKGGDDFVLPTTPEIEQCFAIAPQNDDTSVSYLQLLRGNVGLKGDRIGKVTVRQNFYKLRTEANINPTLRPHDLRRTTAVTLYELTKDIRAVSQILGHTNINTTAKYLEYRDLTKLRELIHSMKLPTEVKQ